MNVIVVVVCNNKVNGVFDFLKCFFFFSSIGIDGEG